MTKEWEPGPPSVRAMLPSAVGGGVVPFVVYTFVRRHVGSDAEALMIAGAFPAAWVAVQWVRRRRLDPIGMIVLFGFVVGVVASVSLGGNAFVLKVRDSAFTLLFGLACLTSLSWRRPLMFFIGRALSAGDDPARVAAFDSLYEFDEGPRTFRTITALWGVGFVVEAGLRVLLAVVLPTAAFLAASSILLGGVTAGMFVVTLRISRAAIRRGRERGLSLPTVEPSVPGAGVATVPGAGSPDLRRPAALPLPVTDE